MRLQTFPAFILTALMLAITGHSAAAAPAGASSAPLASTALSRLPDDAVKRLRENLGTVESPVRAALRQKLDGLQEELSTDDAEAAQAAATASRRERMQRLPMPARRASSHRIEVRQLRDQMQLELAELESQVRTLGSADQSAAVVALSVQVNRRFERLDHALQRLEQSRNENEARGARQSLTGLLNSLKASTTVIPAVPVPTLSPMRPLLRPPGQGEVSRTLPQYAIDHVHAQRYAELNTDQGHKAATLPAFYQGSGFGFFKAAVTLPPVAPDTTTDCNATTADLSADGAEVQITPEIQALAQELHYSPARILRWMLKEVAFEPYWGSLKGATGVLQTRAGNATDQSSLLVALLRASNVPSRFVRGTVALYDMQPTDNAASRVQRWLGTKNYSGSVAYLTNAGGIPGSAYTINSIVQGISFDHVWVQACVPFAAYRGNLADAGGYRWVPLDPSIKDHDYQAGIAVNTPLDAAFYSTYLANRKDQLPPDYFADQVEATARTIKSDASVEDVPYRGTSKTLRLDVLPSATPFVVTQFTNWSGGSTPESSAIPDAHRHKFTVTVKNSGGTTLAAHTVTFPQSVFKRLTVSYAPDAASQSLWNSWGGTLAGLPAGSVNVYPVIKLDGAVAASGSAAATMPLAGQHSITMKLTQGEETDGQCINDNGNPASPKDTDVSCLNKTVYNNVKAGAYYALGVNARQNSNALLQDRAEVLATGVSSHPTAPTPASGAAYDATTGELLHLVLQTYLHDTDQADRRTAALRGFRSVGNYDIGLTGSDMKTDYVFDLPLTVKPAGVYVDFKGGIYGFAKIDSAADFSPSRNATLKAEQVDLAKLSIYSGSALEHHVWQEALRTDAVSTVRGLQYAAETGNPLVSFTSANIGNYATLMQMSGPTSMAAYQTQIQAEVAAGATVTVPRAQIAYTDPVDVSKAWRGAVYMSENAASGAYGALINGSISGGFPLLNSTPLTNLYVPNSTAPNFVMQINNDTSLLSWLTPALAGNNPFAKVLGDPVNMLTGNLIYDHTDFSIKGRGGLLIILQRWYNSGSPQDGPFGYGWTHSFNHVLKLYGVEGGTAKVGWVNGSGGESFFSTASHTGGNISHGVTLNNSAGSPVELTRVAGGPDDGKYRIRERNGMIYLFASLAGPNVVPSANSAIKARLLSISDRNGNTLTLNVNGSGQLATVTDSLARTVLSFTWNGTTPGARITQITDYTGRNVKYAYTDGNGNLTQVTDPLDQIHAYSYYTAVDGPRHNHLLKRNILPRGNGMEFEYYSGGQVFRHTPLDSGGSLIAAGAMSFHYNLFNRESWTVNERGFEHRTTFDANGNALRVVEESGAEQIYTYDPVRPHNRLSETNALGRTHTYTYNSQDLVETQTLPSGAVLEFRDYTSFAQPQRVKDARGNWTWLKYDAKGNLTDRIAVRNGVTPVAGTQPAAGDIVAWSKMAYDIAGNPTSTTRVKNFVAASGPSLTRNWDANRLNVVSLTRSGNRNGAAVNETTPNFGYDALNRLTSGVDAQWYPISMSQDVLDRITSRSDALGKLRRFTFDANNNVKVSELIDGGTRLDSSAHTFDAQDRPTRVLDHAGNLVQMNYDEAGNLTRRVSPDNFAIGIEYDPNNRPFAAFDEDGNRVFSQLDSLGRPTAVTDPNGNTISYQYWGNTIFDGRLRRVIQPTLPGQSSGRAVEVDYDAAGNVIRTRALAADGASSRQSHTFYDELGRVTRTVSAPDDSGQRLQTCYSYDSLSNLTQVKAGATTDTTSATCPGSPAVQLTQTWDDFGQALTKTDALNKVWNYSYDFNGNLASSQSPEQFKVSSNTKTTFSYDPNLKGLLQTRTVPGSGSSGQNLTYTRNALGQVTRAETRDGSNNLIVAYDYGYDAAHRLSSMADSRGSKALAYQWTPGGRLAKVTLNDNGTTTHQWDFKYDAVGRLSAIVAPNGQSVSFALDAGGRLKERSFGNGLTSTWNWLPENSLGGVSHQSGSGASSNVLANHTYTYDVWGNRASAVNTLSGSTQNLSYGYDALDRIKTVSNGTASQTEGYAFDLFGNRITRTVGSPVTQSFTAQFDAAHQLTQIQQTIGGSAVTVMQRYDDNGNLKKLCEAGSGTVSGTTTDCTASGTGSSTTTLTWDGLDQLVSLAKAGTATLNEAYAYDDAGRRIRKTSGATTTQYVYNGEDIAAEWNGSNLSGAPAAVYAHGAGTDEPLLRLTGHSGGTDASALTYLADGLGSVVAGADNIVSGGPVTATSVTGTNNFNAGAYPPAKAIDGDTSASSTNVWVGNLASGSATLTFELGSTQTVSRVKIYRNSFYNPAYVVRDATVQLRQPDNSWLTVGSLSGNTTVDHPEISFTAASGSALRVVFTGARDGGTIVATAEVTLQLDSGPSSLSTQRFDAWGQLLQATGSIPTYGYTGREPDASGLIYYRARYYQPAYGQFVSRDPLGMIDSVSPYAYVNGNPVNANDPGGNVLNFLIGGGANVAIGWGISALTGQNYSLGDAARDFGIGVATSGAGALIKAAQVTRALSTSNAVIGTAQKTGTIGHATRIEYEAAKALDSGADAVYLNRAWGTAAGVKATGDLAKRPDLIVKSGNTIRGIEVGSKTDDVGALARRLEDGASAVNGSRSGMTGIGVADDVIGAQGVFSWGTRTYGYSPLPATYGLGYSLGMNTGYQGLIYSGSAGAAGVK